MRVNLGEIKGRVLVCPYCVCEVSYDMQGHCGESSGHFELAYELDDGQLCLASELELDNERE